MIGSIIVGAVLAAVIVLDIRYLFGQKKQGKCVGCPSGCNCSGGKCSAANKAHKC